MTVYDATGGRNDPGAPTSHVLFFHFATQSF